MTGSGRELLSPLSFPFRLLALGWTLLLRSPSTSAAERAGLRSRKPRFRRLRLSVLLILLALVSLCEPRVFQWVVRNAIVFEAWRGGGRARVGHVEGSLIEPI